MGYLPEAMVNFLALLGWSKDDKTEIMSTEELVKHFTIERVGKAGAVLNLEKLIWMNGVYVRESSPTQLAGALLDFWRRFPPPEIPELPDVSYVLRIVPLIHERMKTLADAAPLIPFFFKEDVGYDPAELVQNGMDVEGTRMALKASLASLSGLSPFHTESIEGALRSLAQELNVKTGQLFGSLRVATTGLLVAPPLFQTMEVLGKERTLTSIQAAIDRL